MAKKRKTTKLMVEDDDVLDVPAGSIELTPSALKKLKRQMSPKAWKELQKFLDTHAINLDKYFFGEPYVMVDAEEWKRIAPNHKPRKPN